MKMSVRSIRFTRSAEATIRFAAEAAGSDFAEYVREAAYARAVHDLAQRGHGPLPEALGWLDDEEEPRGTK